AILNGIIIVIGIIFGDYILKIFLGQIYLEKGLFLYFGYLIILLNFSIVGPYSPLIIATEKYKIYTITLFISLIFSILSWVILIPSLGILAIKLGTWIAVIPQTIFIRYYCFKYFKIGKLKFKYALNLVVISSMIFVSFYLFSLNFSILIRILFCLLILILYLGFLLLSKLLTRNDFKYIINVINPKKMVSYIKEEIQE
ncbi:hypothetical protein LCGC14_3145130, partial [marine sediment metagenome]